MSKFSEVLEKQANAMGLGINIKKQLDKESYQDLLVALGDRSIPIPAILKVLKEIQVPISRAALSRWRNGEPPRGADAAIIESTETSDE